MTRPEPAAAAREILTERSPRVIGYAKLKRGTVRRTEGEFLVEGANSVVAALESGRAVRLLATLEAIGRHSSMLSRTAVPVDMLTERAAVKITDTVTPTGLFAVCGLLDVPVADVLAPGADLVVVPVEMNDPGNAGTLVRTADAMGADGVVFAGHSVDPHQSKVVRASAGSLFHLPIARESNVDAVLTAARAAGLTLVATAADGEVDLDDADDVLAGPVAWLLGNEAHGLAPEVQAAADVRVRIPLVGRAESLNVGSAAAICLYAGARARRARSAGRSRPPASQ